MTILEKLSKMALADLPPGRPPAVGEDLWDYSHLLPEKLRSQGLSIKIEVYPEPSMADLDAPPLRAEAFLFDGKDLTRSRGMVTSFVDTENGLLEIDMADLDPAFQGKGIGKVLYEALMLHSYQQLGIRKVTGDNHSTLASRAHESLSRKHGFNYVPRLNPARKEVDPGEFDSRFLPYEYTLKEEMRPLAKAAPSARPNFEMTEEEELEAVRELEEKYMASNEISLQAFLDSLPKRSSIRHLTEETLLKMFLRSGYYDRYARDAALDSLRLFRNPSIDDDFIKRVIEEGSYDVYGLSKILSVAELTPEYGLSLLNNKKLKGHSPAVKAIIRSASLSPVEVMQDHFHEPSVVSATLSSLSGDEAVSAAEWVLNKISKEGWTDYRYDDVIGRASEIIREFNPEKLLELVSDRNTDDELVERLAPNLSPEFLKPLVRRGLDPEDLSPIFENYAEEITDDHVNLLSDPSLLEEDAIRKLLERAPISGETINNLVTHYDYGTFRDELVRNDNTPSDVIEGLISEYWFEDGDWESILQHPNMTDRGLDVAREYAQEFIDSGGYISDDIRSFIGVYDFRDSYPLPSVSIKTGFGTKKFGVNRLRKLRDHIAEAGGVINKRDLEKQGLHPGKIINHLQDAKGNITADGVQAFIDSLPDDVWDLSTTRWTGAQRHSSKPSMVLQVNLTNDKRDQLWDEGVQGLFEDIFTSSHAPEVHPVAESTIGWVRYTGDGTGFYIDEVQSDFASELTRRYKEARAAKDDDLLKDLQTISDIVFQGNTPYEVLHEAFQAHLRQEGHIGVPVSIPTVETQQNKVASFGHMQRDRDVPVHFKVNYQEVPQKMGWQESTYGTLPTQENPRWKDAPTYQGTVRKVEEELSLLAKAELSSVAGNKLDDTSYDYSSILPVPGKLTVKEGKNGYLRSVFSDGKKTLGSVEGRVSNGVLLVGDARLTKSFRGKGLGKSMYTALFAHAKNVHGVLKARGSVHTRDAARVHRSLLSTYGGDLKPTPSGGYEFLMKNSSTFTMPEELLSSAKAMLGELSLDYLPAVEFLTGKKANPTAYRKALRQYDDDDVAAALVVGGLPVNEQTRAAVVGVSSYDKTLAKREDTIGGLSGREAVPFAPVDSIVAEAVSRALASSAFGRIDNDGKHTYHAEVVYDQLTDEAYIIKYHSLRKPLAAGASQSPASQPRKEAAFYRIAELAGAEDFFPEARLLSMGGHDAVAVKVIRNATPLEDIRKENPSKMLSLLEPYRRTGQLHMWAALDYILGNPDRHGNNILVHDKQLFLIDHGTAFAGPSFDPAFDENSFIPIYLRAWGFRSFHSAPPEERYRRMPRIDSHAERALAVWVERIDEQAIRATLREFGIDPEPVVARLSRLKATPSKHEYLNRYFAGLA